jgi:hypothetical protein
MDVFDDCGVVAVAEKKVRKEREEEEAGVER